MFSPLRNPAYRNLFAAQISALLGTGLATVALGLLAHEIAGANAGEILGAAFAIKMICYVAVAPLASALAARAPRKVLLVGLDLVRAGVAAALPFVSEPWQIYALMSALYAASAAFTPAFQAMIPDLLTDEAEYTKALSLSRLAADLESVASPVLAAALLSFLTFHDLFAGTALGFLVSAGLVVLAALPGMTKAAPRPFIERLSAGLKIYRHTPRLRGLMALSLATAAGGAMVFVNTVVIVQSGFGLSERATAWALAAFGLGSMVAALGLPRLLEALADRTVILAGAVLIAALLAGGPLLATSYAGLAALWLGLGGGYSLTLTPVGRVLRRSSNSEDRPTLFAAQFALSHACWLVAYPAAGLLSANAGIDAAFFSLSALSATGVAGVALLWPAHDPEIVAHVHDDLPADHVHVADAGDHAKGDVRHAAHAHPFVIDALHRNWPAP